MSLPISTPSKRAAPKMSEAQLTRAVMQHWRARGLPNTRVVSIPNMAAHGQPGLTRGVPDLLVVSRSILGGYGLLELKTETGKLSAEQEAFRHDCIIAGGEHRVAYGLDQALETLLDWHVIKPEVK